MLNRLAVACCAVLAACSTVFVDPPPTRDVTLRVFNGSSTTMSNIRVSGGVDDLFSSVKSLEHGSLSGELTVKTLGHSITVIVDAPTPTRTSLSAEVALLTDAELASPTAPVLLTLRFEGAPARLIAELSQPVED